MAQVLTGAAQTAIRNSLSEIVRAEGSRGNLVLNVELCFGDAGVLLWEQSSVSFRQKRHYKDSARESSHV